MWLCPRGRVPAEPRHTLPWLGPVMWCSPGPRVCLMGVQILLCGGRGGGGPGLSLSTLLFSPPGSQAREDCGSWREGADSSGQKAALRRSSQTMSSPTAVLGGRGDSSTNRWGLRLKKATAGCVGCLLCQGPC